MKNASAPADLEHLKPAPAPVQPAYAELASSELTRDLNRDIVLERIRALQPISRVELARASGLQPSTVSSIVERLLEEHWVVESAMVKTARGRRPTLLSLNPDMYFLVADIRPSSMVTAVVDLSGRFLERQIIPLSKDVKRSIDSLAAVLLQFLARHQGKSFQGVGISLPGRIDSETSRLVFSPNLDWLDFPIREHLHQRLGLEVQLENAANAVLLSELWFGHVEGIRNAMLITIAEGVGAAMLADGRLITGRNGMAGEFGHIVVDPAGPLCGCGAHGCWEVFASSRAALQRYQQLAPEAPLCTVLELHGRAIDGDGSAVAALQEQARAIGRGLQLVNAIISPEVILLAGDVPFFLDEFRSIIEEECRAGAMDGEGPPVILIGDGEMSRLRGAAAIVLQRHSGYYRTSHLHIDPR